MPAQILPPEAELFRSYYHYMIRWALCFVSCIDDAEDVVSACWLSLLKHMPLLLQMEGRRQSAYIMASVRNCAIDFQRRYKRKFTVSLDNCSADIPDPESGDSFEQVLLRETVSHLLTLLPEEERRVAELKLRERSDSDISLELHIAPVTVRVHWHRARRRLQAMLKGME